jgi:PEGA domain
VSKGPLLLVAVVVAATVAAPVRVDAHAGPHGAVVVAAAPYYSYNPIWYGWYGYPYPAAYPIVYDNSASLRIQVEPRETEVYVDSYYAGTVNDFDGFFQRLHVSPGQHDIELFLDGYRVVRQQVYLQPGTTFKIRYTMQKLQAGDASEERPTPPPAPPGPPAGAAPPLQPPAPPSPPPIRQRSGARPESAPPADNAFGALIVQVQPGDAEILVDGEPWQSPGGARLVVQLPPGDHRIEVRKNGFETFRSTVRIRAGETTPLNVSLAQE